MKEIIEKKVFKFLFSIINLLKNVFFTIWSFIWDLIDTFYHYFLTKVYKKFGKSFKFKFNNKTYKYFYHDYNFTWRSERAIEIPIILQEIIKNKNKRILEVGNVLGHYFDFKHHIVDKFEQGENIINEDIINYKNSEKYDLIVSISTMEHIGWDHIKGWEGVSKDPNKILKAIENLKSLLKKDGKIIITFPIGWNPFLELLFIEGKLKFSKTYYFKRQTFDNKWEQVSWEQISNCSYNRPFPLANGIIVGIIEKYDL